MYNVEYEIYEKNSDPICCEVNGYTTIEDLKDEAEEIVQKLASNYKMSHGVVAVNVTITDENGSYVDSDEYEATV